MWSNKQQERSNIPRGWAPRTFASPIPASGSRSHEGAQPFLARVSWRQRSVRLLFSTIVAAFLLCHCGGVSFNVRITAATERFDEAKLAGAEEYAAYEFYSAEARLLQARRFAAQAEYGSAILLAQQAERFSEAAIARLRKAQTEGGSRLGTPLIEGASIPHSSSQGPATEGSGK